MRANHACMVSGRFLLRSCLDLHRVFCSLFYIRLTTSTASFWLVTVKFRALFSSHLWNATEQLLLSKDPVLTISASLNCLLLCACVTNHARGLRTHRAHNLNLVKRHQSTMSDCIFTTVEGAERVPAWCAVRIECACSKSMNEWINQSINQSIPADSG